VLQANHPGLAVHADAAEALRAIAERVTPRDRGTGAATAAALRQSVEARLAGQDVGAERRLMSDLRSAVPTTTHTFWDMTIAGYWAWSAWDPLDGEFHSAQGAGGLGFAYPAAVAAAIGSGTRTFAVSGDGGAMYSISELATARQHDADVTWLIVDDGGYGILREYMTDAFGQATATELARPDFVALAASFGIPAHPATLDDVGEVVARTFTTTGPAVVVVPAVLKMFSPT
jgi:acetolactate synthase-1/2/3 large subunit